MKSALETVWESLKLSVKWLQWKLADPRLNGLSGEERPEAEGEAVEKLVDINSNPQNKIADTTGGN